MKLRSNKIIAAILSLTVIPNASEGAALGYLHAACSARTKTASSSGVYPEHSSKGSSE